MSQCSASLRLAKISHRRLASRTVRVQSRRYGGKPCSCGFRHRIAAGGREKPAAGRSAFLRALLQTQRRPCARRPRSHLAGMHQPIFVREPSAAERARLEAALRAPDAFTVRRAQIVLASADGRRPRTIARDLRCATQTVRNGIRAFNAIGVAALEAGSSRPKSAAPVLGEAERERLRSILHQPPRAFGHALSTWTLDLLAREVHGQGLSPAVLSGETIRRALLRLGVGWKRAKRWLTSPDPAYAQKNVGATG